MPAVPSRSTVGPACVPAVGPTSSEGDATAVYLAEAPDGAPMTFSVGILAAGLVLVSWGAWILWHDDRWSKTGKWIGMACCTAVVIGLLALSLPDIVHGRAVCFADGSVNCGD